MLTICKPYNESKLSRRLIIREEFHTQTIADKDKATLLKAVNTVVYTGARRTQRGPSSGRPYVIRLAINDDLHVHDL